MNSLRKAVAVALFLVSLELWSVVQGYPTEENSSIDQIEFHDVSQYVSTSYQVYHMEEDKAISGNIIFTNYNSLKTTDGASPTNIAGNAGSSGFINAHAISARFYNPRGFHQINATHVIVSDRSNHCLRLVNRLTLAVSTFSGRCQSSGSRNGNSANALFSYPWGMILDKTNQSQLIVSQSGNNWLRSVDLTTGAVNVLVSSGLSSPKGMTWDKIGKYLYVVNSNFIAKVNWVTKQTSRLVGTTSYSNVLGNFVQSRFQSPYEMALLYKNVYVLLENGGSQLKAVNMDTNTVSSITVKTPSGSLSSIYSVAHINGSLFVGGYRKIYKLAGLSYKNVETVYIRPGDSTVSVTIDSHGNTAVLPAGEYQFNIPALNSSGYVLKVKEGSVARRVVLTAEYSVSCNSLYINPLSKALLDPVLKHKVADFQDICGSNCNMSAVLLPSYTCSGNVLKVTWPTNTTYPEIVTEIPDDLLGLLEKRISTGGPKKAEIIIFSQRVQFLQPRVDENGESMKITLNSSCIVEGQTYQPSTDRCN